MDAEEKKRLEKNKYISFENGGLYLRCTPQYGYFFKNYLENVIVTEFFGQMTLGRKGRERIGTISTEVFKKAKENEYPDFRLNEIADMLMNEKRGKK